MFFRSSICQLCASLALVGLIATYSVAGDGDAKDASKEASIKKEAKSSAATVIDQFTKSVRDNEKFAKEKRDEAVAILQEYQQDSGDLSPAISEALGILYPDFQQALVDLADEKFDSAIKKLSEFTKSDNPYLAVDAVYYKARALMSKERFEQAAKLLEQVQSKGKGKTLQSGNALFLTGVAQTQMLLKKEAVKSFERYLKDYPDAPERMKVGAFRQLEQLKYVEDGALADVHLRMEFSRRRLALEDSGDNTQDQQNKIIAMLDKLIEEAEKQECNCRGGGGGQGQGQGAQGGGGKGDGTGKNGQGGNNQQETKSVRRVYRAGPRSPWSKVRNKERDPAFSAIKEKFPARYLQLVEQYYKSFQEENAKK